MAFSDETIRSAWSRANGRCECRRLGHGHSYVRCNRQLVWDNRGRESDRGAWEAHHRISVDGGGTDDLSNCGILCWDCHSKIL